MDPLLIVIAAAVAIVVLIVVSVIVRRRAAARPPRPGEAQRAGPLAGAFDVVDRSIALYLIRRLTGRPTSKPVEPSSRAAVLTAEEVAYRIGKPGAPVPRPREGFGYTGAAAVGAAVVTPAGSEARAVPAIAPPVGPTAPRQRLVRDAGYALLAFGVLALLAVLVLPQGVGIFGHPASSVFSVVRVTPKPTPSPTSDSTGVLTATPRPTGPNASLNPSVTGPAQAFYPQTVASTTMNAHISWSGSDAGTGIAKYQLQVSVDGGSFVTLTLASSTSTSINRTLKDGRSYRFRVRATDRRGNVSAYAYGPTFTTARLQDSSSNVVYVGPWTASATSSAQGGSQRWASSLAARASLARSVRDFAWVATRTPAAGSAQIWIDDVLAATVDLRSASTSYRQLVFHRHFSNLAPHSIEIRPIGGGRIYLDAFLLMR
jgi:hypothetical protein